MKTLVEKIADDLEEYIEENFLHGDKLPSNVELTKKFRVSSKTIHDAIKILTKKGILHTRRGQYGTIVLKDYDSKIDGLFICGSPSYNSLSVFGRFLTGIMGLWRGGRLRPAFLWTMASASYNRRFRDEGPMAWICSDPEVRKSFAANPHCNFIFTVNASHSLFCMMREAYSYSGWKVGNPNMMIYFISGTDDPCLINEKRFHHAAQHMAGRGYMNVTSALYPNMRHEVLNEIGKEAVWMDILEHINPTGRPNV
jgi:alpha-beta hydrolase superfamily lysophospholipase